jgi:hypothetical protein
MHRGEVGQRAGELQVFGAVLFLGERHQLLRQRLSFGVFLCLVLRQELAVHSHAIGIGDGQRRCREEDCRDAQPR